MTKKRQPVSFQSAQRAVQRQRDEAMHAVDMQAIGRGRRKIPDYHFQLQQEELSRGKQLLGGRTKAYRAFEEKRRAGEAFPLPWGPLISYRGHSYGVEEWNEVFGARPRRKK